MNENLKKSIDDAIDILFEESVEKAIDIAKDSSNTADEVVNKAPKGKDDDKRGAGRPKQISDVPAVDEDGKRAKNYDADIKERDGKEEENPEAKKQCKEKNQVKKSEEEVVEKLTKSERSELEAFRAEKIERETELRKAEEAAKQEDLIKSIVNRTAARYDEKIESLQKSLTESNELVRAIANKPQRAKSVTNINALEKSDSTPREETFSKSEMLDAAETLWKSGEIKDTQVIELENNGGILDPIARAKVEAKVKELHNK